MISPVEQPPARPALVPVPGNSPLNLLYPQNQRVCFGRLLVPPFLIKHRSVQPRAASVVWDSHQLPWNRNRNHLFKHLKVPKSLRAITEGLGFFFFPSRSEKGPRGLQGRMSAPAAASTRRFWFVFFFFFISFSIP